MKSLPNPNGCRLCGIDQRSHAIQAGPDGSHTWTAPTQQQIKDRMQARRVADDAAEQDVCRAAQYGDRSLCGCMDCIEYTADRDSEDGC